MNCASASGSRMEGAERALVPAALLTAMCRSPLAVGVAAGGDRLAGAPGADAGQEGALGEPHAVLAADRVLRDVQSVLLEVQRVLQPLVGRAQARRRRVGRQLSLQRGDLGAGLAQP